MTERALITGITGFVGRHLCAHLLEHGNQILGIAPELPKDAPAWGRLPPSDALLLWDLGQPEIAPHALHELVRRVALFRPTVVYHLAAIAVPEDCGQNEPTPRAWSINVEGTRRVIELVRRGAPDARFVFTSTSHVYRVPQDSVTFVDELYQVSPRNAYAQTKWAAEQLVLSAVANQSLNAVVVRAFPHSGPGQSERMMLPSWTSQLVRGKTPLQVHTLQATIDLCDVRDVVRAYHLLATSGVAGEVYNLGSGIPRTSGQILDILRATANAQVPIVEMRPGVKYDPVARIDKLAQTAGWQPVIPIEQTVADTYEWWCLAANRRA